jgi:hypothetical protein
MFYEYAVFALIFIGAVLILLNIFIKKYRNIMLIFSFIVYSLLIISTMFSLLGKPITLEHAITKMKYSHVDKLTIHYYITEERNFIHIFGTLDDSPTPVYIKMKWSEKSAEKMNKIIKEQKEKKKGKKGQNGNPSDDNDTIDGEKIEVDNPFGLESLEDRPNAFKHPPMHRYNLKNKDY